MKEKTFSLEISDVIEPEQEAAVIEAVKEYVRKDQDELREYFRTTDTIEVCGLDEDEARALQGRLERCKVTLSLRRRGVSQGVAADSGEQASVTCPRCGTRLESLDWRCPECFYEFPEYDYRDEVE
jgi:tRNA(Ile2) C34 agmatinyltransferase TiaS